MKLIKCLCDPKIDIDLKKCRQLGALKVVTSLLS